MFWKNLFAQLRRAPQATCTLQGTAARSDEVQARVTCAKHLSHAEIFAARHATLGQQRLSQQQTLGAPPKSLASDQEDPKRSCSAKEATSSIPPRCRSQQ